MTDYYDGPTGGVADFHGSPHRYEGEWNEADQQFGPWFLLTPIDADTLQCALEAWEIWLRWREAFESGHSTQETHPALPDDRLRWEVLQKRLVAGFAAGRDRAFRAKAQFRSGPRAGLRPGDCSHLQVRWHAA